MQSLILSAALLGSTVLAQGDPASISAQFSSAANQIISLYIPQSLAVPFGVAIQSAASAASVTGDINSIVESALTAETPPPFLTAIPTVYQSNLMSLESAISALRGAANTGISGAARVTTATDSAGSTFTSTMPAAATNGSVLTTTNSAGSTYTTTESGSMAGGAIVVLTTTNSNGSTYTTTMSEMVVTTTNSAGSTVTSTMSGSASPVVVVTTTDTAGSTITSTQSGSSSSSAPPSSSTPPPSSSAAPSSSKSAFAAPTQVPFAAAGAIGLVGLLAAL
ncbi:MAG: hypothetical protein M1830_007027 [Pleopsidium flavum]|nr:MAG: hypothetical protein M1830_007027 [Pleopsidium flavum]